MFISLIATNYGVNIGSEALGMYILCPEAVALRRREGLPWSTARSVEAGVLIENASAFYVSLP